MTEQARPGTQRMCIFCGVAGDLTVEHVLPKWIWRGPDGKRTVSRVRAGQEPGGLQEMHLHSGDGILGAYYAQRGHPFVPPPARTVKSVCRRCNNGWMSTLEASFQALLKRMVSRPQWRLRPHEVTLLRRWAMKTAVLHEFTDAESRLADTDVLTALREEREPPGTWYVGLARAHSSLGEGLESCPVVLKFSTEQGDSVAAVSERQMVCANHHLITVWGLAIVVRYSPCPIEAPARLDHDLRALPGGPPLALSPGIAGRTIQKRDLVMWTPDHARDSDAWFHALDERGGPQMVCRSDGIFRIAHSPLLNESDFHGFATAVELIAPGEVVRVTEVEHRVRLALATATDDPPKITLRASGVTMLRGAGPRP